MAVDTPPDTVTPSAAQRPLAVAIDVGSSSVRAAVYDRLGRVVDGLEVHVAYAWEVAPDGEVRSSAQMLLGVVDDAMHRLHGAVGPLAGDIVAGGVSCLLHSIVGLDDAGRPMTSVLSWADTSSASEAADLRDRLDSDAVHATTGAPIHAGYWPARIARLRRECPGIRRWAGLPELLSGHLTGRVAVSRSMASGTGLLDRAEGTWSAPLLEALGVDVDELPAILDDDEALGGLDAASAARWPRLSGATWFAPWGDGPCGSVGLAAARPGAAALMVGSSGALRTVVTEPAPPIVPGLFAQRLGGGAVVGGQLSEGGGTLAWASDLFRRSRASLERAAAALEPDGHGLTVLPYPLGERGLGYHDGARGAVIGLRSDTDAAAIYRAILESIAISFAAIDDRLTSVVGGVLDVTASGGVVAHSPLLASVLADALGRDIRVASTVESSCRGAALLALHGAGVLDGPADVPAPPARTVPADPDRTARYRAARERRDALYTAILG